MVCRQEITILKATLTMIAVAMAFGSLPATARQAGPDTNLAREVTQVGLHEGQRAVVAQLEPGLGNGAKVLIPAEMMTQQGDCPGAEEVKTISKPMQPFGIVRAVSGAISCRK